MHGLGNNKSLILFFLVFAFHYLVNIELHFMDAQGRVVCRLFGVGTQTKI